MGTLATRRRFLPVLAAIAALLAPCVSSAKEPLETAIKANYLYKFAPFVTWPTGSFATADAPLQLCIVGLDPFGTVIDRAVEGVQIDGHSIVVKRMPEWQQDAHCHIAFVEGQTATAHAALLRAANGPGVLTVTDKAKGQGGGILEFVVRDGRIRYTANRGAAAAAGVSLSSKLLQLAVNNE